MAFAHLHVHTHYSILDGHAMAKDLFKLASEYKMPGLAITDNGTMAGIPEFLEQAKMYPEIKPVIGCEFYITHHFEHTEKDFEHRRYYHVVLLAKNLKGYSNLVRLCSIANIEGIYYKPRISHRLLQENSEGLICLTGCLAGEISWYLGAGMYNEAREAAIWYKDVFGEDFYLETMLHSYKVDSVFSQYDNSGALKSFQKKIDRQQRKINDGIFTLSQELNIKVVATNDVHFTRKEDAIAHDILTSFQVNADIFDQGRLRYTHQEYLKTEEQMLALFRDHPEAVQNTTEILEKVERFDIESPNIDDYFLEQRLREEWKSWKGSREDFFEHLKEEFGQESVAVAFRFKALGEKEAINRVARAYSLDMCKLLENWGHPGMEQYIAEVRAVAKNLTGRIYSGVLQECAWVVCPGRAIWGVVPCMNYLSGKLSGKMKDPLICTQYDLSSCGKAGLAIVK